MAFTGETITYSELSNGWTSFWSYLPDWMLGMNSSFYTWKNGDIYQHNSNATRNAFYKDWSSGPTYPYFTYDSTVTTVFNEEALLVKMFKSIAIDSTQPWDVELTTDMSTGYMDSTYFTEKEGMWYSYIRRLNDGTYDTKAISTQGVGALTSYTGGTLTINFGFNIGTSISVGDIVYKVSAGALVLIGPVASYTDATITLSSAAVTPAGGDVIVYVKNAQAESYGARGYYMDAKLTNSSTTEVELFSLVTNTFISKP